MKEIREKKDLAIIGASYLQLPLIEKAKALGYTTHVFAWAAGDVGEAAADRFYPISIVEKDAILEKCREIGVVGICSIASDLAMLTVNHVANALCLPGNTPEATFRSTNKNAMRRAFEENGDPSPRSYPVETAEDVPGDFRFPVIVKPLDRSGSRGITKVMTAQELPAAIGRAREQGFDKRALVEEFVTGQEYSVECLSQGGEHHFLAVTKKYTTGAPGFIETGHLEPAPLTEEMTERIKSVTFHALDSLGIRNGASHTELKINGDGEICLIEIGGRMGGDCIGSDLVELSTGVDFVRAVIDISVGREPLWEPTENTSAAGIRFIFTEEDLSALERLKKEHPEYLVREDVHPITGCSVSDSSTRFGYFLFRSDRAEDLLPYLPKERE